MNTCSCLVVFGSSEKCYSTKYEEELVKYQLISVNFHHFEDVIMAAPSLTLTQQKASLSGKKNKKKVIKNVLDLPTSVKVECHVADTKEADRLNKIVERLLSDARLSPDQGTKFKKGELSPDELKQREQASDIRNQLALGVNDLNRCAKKQLVSAALIESDIQPKFLVHHINLLCHHNKIPFVHLPGLRRITKNSLGFPCIALGFKKDFSHFLEAISEIKSIATTQTDSLDKNKEDSVETDNSDEDSDILEGVVAETKSKDGDTPFTYLYRTSIDERKFIPQHNHNEVKISTKLGSEFISIDTVDEDNAETKKESKNLGISSNLVRGQKKRGKLLDLEDLNESDDEGGSDYEGVYSMPKKKSKKDWVIDKVGTKQKFIYSPAKILKVQPNPKRIPPKVTNKND